jgi:hypothetical protein
MKPLIWTAVLVAGTLLAGGCHAHGYNSQPLGDVPYPKAFEAGKAALAQYFSIASADETAGRIITRPKSVEAGRDRLLATSPARQVATLRIRKADRQLYADIRVSIQRQDVGAMRQMRPVTVDTELPTGTPAQETAALAADQNQAWQNTGRDEGLERTILDTLMEQLAKK